MKNNDSDIRWIQRLANFEKALNGLQQEVEEATSRTFSILEKKGLIQSFEMVHELGWNLIKDFFALQGDTDIYGSKDAFQLAFNRGIVKSGEILMESIKSRNLSSHSYDEETADDIFNKIVNSYYEAFEEIRSFMLSQRQKKGL